MDCWVPQSFELRSGEVDNNPEAVLDFFRQVSRLTTWAVLSLDDRLCDVGLSGLITHISPERSPLASAARLNRQGS